MESQSGLLSLHGSNLGAQPSLSAPGSPAPQSQGERCDARGTRFCLLSEYRSEGRDTRDDSPCAGIFPRVIANTAGRRGHRPCALASPHNSLQSGKGPQAGARYQPSIYVDQLSRHGPGTDLL
jgi:hypothetical protein